MTQPAQCRRGRLQPIALCGDRAGRPASILDLPCPPMRRVLGDPNCMLDTRIRLSDANVLVLGEHRLAGMSPGPASDDSAFGCVSDFTFRGAWTV